MLTETRQDEILQMLEEKGSVTVQELTEKFRTSESTIRRDLNALHKKGALIKVFGGAVQAESRLATKDEKVALRKEQNRDQKIRIARYAAFFLSRPRRTAPTTVPATSARRYISAFPTTGNTKIPP